MTEYEYGPRRAKIVVDGERISALRRDMALTQRELAIKARVSLSTITRIEENGENGTHVYGRTWRNIARALGLRSDTSAESIRIFEAYTFEGRTSDGVYHRDPERVVERYDRMSRGEES